MALTKAQELAKVKGQNEKLLKMVNAEREKVKGYEEIAKVYSAYIAILLKKLGATDSNNAITIPKVEIAKALEHYETRAMVEFADYSIKLYCEVTE